MLGDCEDIFYRLDVVCNGCQFDFQTCCWLTFSSAFPVHSSFAKNTILLNPETFSCLNHEEVGASDLLKGEEVEVGQLVPGEVEVLAHPSVPVVPHSPPVLCAPLPAGPSVADLANILARLPQALSCPM